jgi:uncharacterized protein YacL
MSNPDLQQLQQIWKTGSLPDAKQPSHAPEQKQAVWDRIDRFQRKIRRENIWVTLCFLATSAVLGFIWYWYEWQQLYTSLGILLIILAMGGSLYFFFQRVMEKRHRDLGQNSRAFIREAVQSLQQQRMMIKRIIPIYALMLISGLNLVYLDILNSLSLHLRLIIHIMLTAILAVFFYFSRKHRLSKFNQTYGRDLELLQSVLRELEK